MLHFLIFKAIKLKPHLDENKKNVLIIGGRCYVRFQIKLHWKDTPTVVITWIVPHLGFKALSLNHSECNKLGTLPARTNTFFGEA